MMQIVYEVWHYQIVSGQEIDSEDEHQSEKFVGVYSTLENAEAIITTLLSQPGFRDWPDGFQINHTPLDRTSWEGGFFSIDDWYREMEAEGLVKKD